MKGQPLSPRETTVLHLIAWGYTNKEIALRLDLSVKTVEAHKANGMRKLGLGGRADVVKYGVESGWLALHAAPQLPARSPESGSCRLTTALLPDALSDVPGRRRDARSWRERTERAVE